jgi:hypothetical protein
LTGPSSRVQRPDFDGFTGVPDFDGFTGVPDFDGYRPLTTEESIQRDKLDRLATRIIQQAGSVIFTAWGDHPLTAAELAGVLLQLQLQTPA